MNFARYATRHARHLPDKVCLVERVPSTKQRRTLTWSQFNEATNRVANYLSNELGIKKGQMVMHLEGNSLEWLITYFAVIKIGAVIVPLNFRFVGTDILYAAQVCKPRLFIVGADYLPVVTPILKELTSIESYICIGDPVPEEMLDYGIISAYNDTSEALVQVEDHHDLALMFTSGTTGSPKPVIHTHHSLNNAAIGNGMSFSVEENDNYLFFLPLYHSGTMFLWSAYYAMGATGTLLKEFKELPWILEVLDEEKGTDTLFVVPIAVTLLNKIESGEIKLSDYDLSRWKHLGIGAQPIPSDVLRGLRKTFPCRVSNIYGTTEGGGGGTIKLESEDILRKPGSIGKPTFGVEAKVVDSEGRELCSGEVGELILATERLMKGYYHNPEMTDEVLKEGWVYTGDLVRTDEEGYFHVVDRKKDMITTGGENIYPIEIEDALMEHPKIDDVACIGFPDKRLVEIVMAIVQTKQGERLKEDEVIEFAKSKLALYKVPRKVVFDPVVRDPAGKLRKAWMREKYTGRKEAFQKLS